MKNSDEMFESLIRRRDEHNAKLRRRRKTAAKIAAPLLSLCIITGAGFAVFHTGNDMPDTQTSSKTNGDSRMTDDEYAESSAHPSTDAVSPSTDNGLFHYGGKTVSSRLYDALIKADGDEVIAILVRPAEDKSFVFEGKTIGEYDDERNGERMLSEKLYQLLKEGEYLKYGTALYETGMPDGEKWDKSLYDSRVEFYGSKILEKYISGGEFLREQLEKDLEGAKNADSAEKNYMRAFDAFLTKTAEEIKGEKPSVVCTDKFGVAAYFTKAGFDGFNADKSGWTYDLLTEEETVYPSTDD